MADARRALGVAAVACVLALTGCTGDGPVGPTPSPTPVAPTPTETAQERQERLDYAAAEKAYRTFRAEYERVLRAGGAEQPTNVMRQTATGTYLKTFTTVVQGFKAQGSRHIGVARIGDVRQGGYSSGALILTACEDNRDVITHRKHHKDERGGVLSVTIEVTRVNSVWKLSSGSGKSIESCH